MRAGVVECRRLSLPNSPVEVHLNELESVWQKRQGTSNLAIGSVEPCRPVQKIAARFIRGDCYSLAKSTEQWQHKRRVVLNLHFVLSRWKAPLPIRASR